jgi:hypothetical protein
MLDMFQLKGLKTYFDDENGWCLRAVYKREDDTGIYEVTVPKIHLPTMNGPVIKTPICICDRYSEPPTIDLGFGDLNMLKDETGHLYYEKLVKEKIHNMTLDEIEKKLGFKVRVVSEKEM